MQHHQKKFRKTAGTPVIVLSGGGTGGHITPLLSLARALKAKEPGCNLVYIGHKGDKFDLQEEGFHDFDFIGFVNGGKFRRYHGESVLSQILDFKTMILNVRDFFRFLSSIGKAWRILSRVKPDVVFSKGGFVAVPVGIAAKVRRIPIVTHDSDTIPGLANKIIGRWAIVRATGMPVEFYDFPARRSVYTGIPIDPRIKNVDKELLAKYKKQIGINVADIVLLVAGGSLGARDINDKVLRIAPELLNSHPRLHLVHITGAQNEEEVKRQYSVILKGSANKKVIILGFTSEFYKYAGAADLIVSRAGATTIAEFAAEGKACILIPNPFLTGGHQVKNAEQLQKIGAVEIVANNASAETLLGEIVKLLASPLKRRSLARNLAATAKLEAADNLANILLDITKHEK
jgi:UDP-N-acetylglucosamine--N-acetylmuramyl-(pentapeptide) pyrophosphoryl-undecaprenol N-acetylglucosamine transferase